MKYIQLGDSDLQVSRICMGCMGFGDSSKGQHSWTVDEAQTKEIIKHGLEAGINFYDTAIAYQSGTSEQYVGKALRDLTGRDDYVIATKFTPRTQDEIDNGVSGQQHIENYLDQSISIQGHHNLIAREEEREMMPFCKDQNIAMTPYSALAGGRLSRLPGGMTKRYQEDAYARLKYAQTAEADNRIIERVAETAAKRGGSMTEVSLAWLLTKVTAPVVGATKFHHVEAAAKATELVLTEQEILYLEELYVPHPLVGVMAQNGKQKAGNVV